MTSKQYVPSKRDEFFALLFDQNAPDGQFGCADVGVPHLVEHRIAITSPCAPLRYDYFNGFFNASLAHTRVASSCLLGL
jgi:hypothetical protein